MLGHDFHPTKCCVCIIIFYFRYEQEIPLKGDDQIWLAHIFSNGWHEKNTQSNYKSKMMMMMTWWWWCLMMHWWWWWWLMNQWWWMMMNDDVVLSISIKYMITDFLPTPIHWVCRTCCSYSHWSCSLVHGWMWPAKHLVCVCGRARVEKCGSFQRFCLCSNVMFGKIIRIWGTTYVIPNHLWAQPLALWKLVVRNYLSNLQVGSVIEFYIGWEIILKDGTRILALLRDYQPPCSPNNVILIPQ